MIGAKAQPEPELLEWLVPVESLTKADWAEMQNRVRNGQWDLWALGPPAEGVAVTYPVGRLLFIHYLRGRGLFDSLTLDDLLQVSRSQGLDGLACDVYRPGMVRLLGRAGWVVVEESPHGWWRMEIADVRRQV